MLSAITEGGGRAATETEQVRVELNCSIGVQIKYCQSDLFVSSGAEV